MKVYVFVGASCADCRSGDSPEIAVSLSAEEAQAFRAKWWGGTCASSWVVPVDVDAGKTEQEQG